MHTQSILLLEHEGPLTPVEKLTIVRILEKYNVQGTFLSHQVEEPAMGSGNPRKTAEPNLQEVIEGGRKLIDRLKREQTKHTPLIRHVSKRVRDAFKDER